MFAIMNYFSGSPIDEGSKNMDTRKKTAGSSPPKSPDVKEIDFVRLKNLPLVYELEYPKNEVSDLKKKPDDEIRFGVLGCPDNNKEVQQKVAALMQEIIKERGLSLETFEFLGDSFLHNGLPHDKHQRWQVFINLFYDVYKDIIGKFLASLGNHCHDLHGGNKHPEKNDFKRASYQVEHTYLDNKQNVDPKKLARFSYNPEDTKAGRVVKIPVDQLSKWVMPNRHYAILDKGVLRIHIDSSTYARDFLEAERLKKERLKGQDPDAPWYRFFTNEEILSNQVLWQEMVHLEYLNAPKILSTHHGFFTPGKRETANPDTKHYLTIEDIKEFEKIHQISGGYNHTLKEIMLKKQKLKFDLILAAHDHMQVVYQDEKEGIFQVTAGGAGGPLQNRMHAENHQNVLLADKQHGFSVVSVKPSKDGKHIITVDVFNNLKQHFKFINQVKKPIREICVEDDAVIKIRQCMLETYDKFMAETNKSYSTSFQCLADGAVNIGYDYRNGLVVADDIRNFFNQNKAITFDECTKFLDTYFDDIRRYMTSLLMDFTFVNSLEKALNKQLKMSFKEYKTLVKQKKLPHSASAPHLALPDTKATLSSGLSSKPSFKPDYFVSPPSSPAPSPSLVSGLPTGKESPPPAKSLESSPPLSPLHGTRGLHTHGLHAPKILPAITTNLTVAAPVATKTLKVQS